MEKILVVEDDRDMQFLLSSILKRQEYELLVAGEGRKALKETKRWSPDLVLLDIRLPDMNGIKILEEMKRINRDLAIIMLTAYGDIKGAVQAMRLGAFEYITKPFDNDELLIVIKRALQTQYLTKEVQSLREKLGGKTALDLMEELAGESHPMKHILKQIDIVSPTHLTVLLQGESGTGKELVAQLIHKRSIRSDKTFVAVDCGAIPESLVESELFGYDKGAFTGADIPKEGRFEQANGGTLFLDEITNLSDLAQATLLRVLQEKQIKHLGGKKDVKVDVRIIVASNVDFPSVLKAGTFRSDLFHRLNEFPITLPPLRERKEDIPHLVNRFLEEAGKEFNKDVKEFSSEAIRALLNHHWSGNVRELRNTVRRAVLVAESDKIAKAHLFLDTSSEPHSGPGNLTEKLDIVKALKRGVSLHEIAKKEIDNIEWNIIEQALSLTGGNKLKAANMLGIDRTTLYARLNNHK
jgi:DNA-binding NtrC family response regulator